MLSLCVFTSINAVLLKKSFAALIAAISMASIPMSAPLVPAPISDLFLIILSVFFRAEWIAFLILFLTFSHIKLKKTRQSGDIVLMRRCFKIIFIREKVGMTGYSLWS